MAPAPRREAARAEASSGTEVPSATRVRPMTNSETPSFLASEADLVLECRKIYWQDFDDRNFLSARIAEQCPQMDYHRVFFGEILRIRGSAAFRKK